MERREGEGIAKDSSLEERKDQSLQKISVVKSKWFSSDMMKMKLTVSPALIATKII